MAEREPHVSIAAEAQPILGSRWAQGTSTQALETIALTRPRGDSRRADRSRPVAYEVGGVIAAVGSRLIEAGAKKMMDEFFRCMSRQLAAGMHESR